MRKYIIGSIFGMLLSFSISANAEVITSLIGRAVEGQFVVKLNDKVLENQAIVLDGTSYLPVRAIGEALNLEVGFNADLGITLKNKPSQVTGSVPPMPTVPTTETKEKQLYGINVQITDLKVDIQGATTSIAIAEHDMTSADSDQKEKLKKKIDDMKAKITDSERQITELEAQKAQLRTP